ncbi:MAG TPA: hypothetical protein VF791_18215 [Pyrinomonadaceae bacterium]
MGINQIQSNDERELLKLADETAVRALFREWLADQLSPEKSREERRINNRAEFKVLRRNWRFFIPLIILNAVGYLLLRFLGNLGFVLTVVTSLIMLVVYILLGLRSARRGLSERIRNNKLRFLRLKSEAHFLLDLIPEGTRAGDVLEALRETDMESKSQNNLDRALFGFGSKALTVGPLAFIALAYLFNLVASADAKAVIEAHQTLGTALGYAIPLGLVLAFANEFIVTKRSVRSERISQILALAQDIYTQRTKISAESNP